MTTQIFIGKTVSPVFNLKTGVNTFSYPTQPTNTNRIGFLWEITSTSKRVPFGNTSLTLQPVGKPSNTSVYFTQEFFNVISSFTSGIVIDLICYPSPSELPAFEAELAIIQELKPNIQFNYSAVLIAGTTDLLMESSGETITQVYFDDSLTNRATLRGQLAGIFKDKVLIKGTEFYPTPSKNPEAKFNGISGNQIHIRNPQELTLIEPGTSQAGPAEITVTTQFGTVTNSTLVSYIRAPTITGLSKSYGPVQGQNLKIYGTGFYASPEFSVTFNQIIPSISIVPATSYGIDSPGVLSVVVPQLNPGLITIKITTLVGTVSNQTYTCVSAPTITSIIFNGTTNNFCGTNSLIVNNINQINSINQVIITGTGFYGEDIFGELPIINFNGIALADVQINSSTEITATVPTKATNSSVVSGPVEVSIRTVGGYRNYPSTPSPLFKYIRAPTITGITTGGKTVGNSSGNYTLNIIGTEFYKFNLTNQTGISSDFNSLVVSVNGQTITPTITNSTTLSVSLPKFNPITPSGSAFVSIKTPFGTWANWTGSETTKQIIPDLDFFTFAAPPTISSILIDGINGKVGINKNTGAQIEILGTEFYGTVTVELFEDNARKLILTPSEKTTSTISLNFPALSSYNSKQYNIVVSTPVAIALKEIYLAGDPTITSVKDSTGADLIYRAQSNTTPIKIIGSEFLGVKKIKFNNIEVVLSNAKISLNEIQVVPPYLQSGRVGIYIENVIGNVFLYNGYTCVGVPQITYIEPTIGLANTENQIVISGVNFYNPEKLNITFNDLSLSDITVKANNEIWAKTPIKLEKSVDIVLFANTETVTLTNGISYTKNQYIYIQQNGNEIEFFNGTNWELINWPYTITNTQPLVPLVLMLTTDLIMTSVNNYFITGSENIIFNGNYKKVIIDGVQNYPGLIKNGNYRTFGFTNITVKNFSVEIKGTSSLAAGAGWIAQAYFASGISSNTVTITNCYSTGPIRGNSTSGLGSGGIVGSYLGSQMSGTSTINISSCYSTGEISILSGGIVGSDAGSQMSGTSTINISSCYSTGNVTGASGGIVGSFAASSASTVTTWTFSVTGCYSTGTVEGGVMHSGPYYGVAKNSRATNTNCYSTAGSTWSDSAANTALVSGIPSGTNISGTIWTSLSLNTPYKLTEFISTNQKTMFIRQTITDIVNVTAEYSYGKFWEKIIWPFTLVNTSNEILTVSLTTDMDINSIQSYFIIGSDGITFDGNNKTVTVRNTGSGYPGLIQNSDGLSNGKNNITVRNVYVKTFSSEKLINGSGWICHANFGFGATNNVITNCFSNGNISGLSGGISGGGTGRKNGNVTITNCYSTGLIEDKAGGIVGSSSGQGDTDGSNLGSIIITNCYSLGKLNTTKSGAIFGYNSRITAESINNYSAGKDSTDNTEGNNWVTSDASGTLQEIGTVWFETTQGSPYVLKSFVQPPLVVFEQSIYEGNTQGNFPIGLTGNGLNRVNRIKFENNFNSTILQQMENYIQVVVPASVPFTGNPTIQINTIGGSQTYPSSSKYLLTGPPTINSFSPVGANKNTQGIVKIIGTCFHGNVQVSFLVGNSEYQAAGVTILSSTLLQVRLPQVSESAGGKIKVTTILGSFISEANFYFSGEIGQITLSENTGAKTGTKLITISGDEFYNIQEVKFGANKSNNIVPISSTQFNVSVPASTKTGLVNVSITTYAGTFTYPNYYTYIASPTITSVVPPINSITGPNTITIFGESFYQISEVKINGISTTIISQALNRVTVTLNQTQTTGYARIEIIGSKGYTTYSNDSKLLKFVGPPEISPTNPIFPSDDLGSSEAILTINGSGFTDVSGITFENTVFTETKNSSVNTNQYKIISDTEIKLKKPVTTVGIQQVQITSPGGTGTCQFVTPGVPTIGLISPDIIASGSSISITGNWFYSINSITIGSTNILSSSYTVNPAKTAINFNLPVLSIGSKVIKITTKYGIASGTFICSTGPEITSITPNAGPTGENTTIVITGNNFISTSPIIVNFNGSEVSNDKTSGSTITITSPINEISGPVDIQVITSIGTATTRYTYVGPPTITSMFPIGGPATSDTTITITGTNFYSFPLNRLKLDLNIVEDYPYKIISPTQMTFSLPARTNNLLISGLEITTVGGYRYKPLRYNHFMPPVITYRAVNLINSYCLISGSNIYDPIVVKINGTTINPNLLTKSYSLDGFFIETISFTQPIGNIKGKKLTISTLSGETAAYPNFTDFNGSSSIDNVSFTVNKTNNPVNATITISGTNIYLPLKVLNNGISIDPHYTQSLGSSVEEFVFDTTSVKEFVFDTTSAKNQIILLTGNGTLLTRIVNIDNQDFPVSTVPAIYYMDKYSGKSGDLLEITGDNISTSVTIWIDTVQVSNPIITLGSIKFTVPVLPTNGLKEIEIINGETTLKQFNFDYFDLPTITRLSVSSCAVNASIRVVLYGTCLTTNSIVKFAGQECSEIAVNVEAGTIDFNVPPIQTNGFVDVTLLTDNKSYTLSNGFEYVLPPPNLTSLTPSSGLKTGNETVIIQVENLAWSDSVQVRFGIEQVQITAHTINTITVITPPQSVPGTVNVIVTNQYGSSSSDIQFNYLPIFEVTSIDIAYGNEAGGTHITISGYKLDLVTSIKFGDNNGTISEQAANAIKVTAPSGTGKVPITLYYGTGNTPYVIPDAFEYRYDLITDPRTLTVSPNVGLIGGNNEITISGRRFDTVSSVKFGTTNATTFSVEANTIKVTVPAATQSGTVDIIIDLTGSDSITINSGFTYGVLPVVSSILTNKVNVLGQANFKITGSDLNGVTKITVGQNEITRFTSKDDTYIEFALPAHVPGSVDIVVTNFIGSTTLTGKLTYTNETYLYLKKGSTSGAISQSPNKVTWSNIDFTADNGWTISKTGTDVLNVVLTEDLVITNPTSWFKIGSSGITFDGAGHKVYVNDVTNYPGLFKNRNFTYTNITIRDLGVLAWNSTLNAGDGWICQNGFGSDVRSGIILIDSCYATWETELTSSSGGIVGLEAFFGATGNAQLIVTSCYTFGPIGESAGGICGGFAGKLMGGRAKIIISSCYTTGSIVNAGGILGISGGYLINPEIDDAASVTVTSCYSSGAITEGGGGIVGLQSTAVTQTNCYSANNQWSDAVASTILDGTPATYPGIGIKWASIGNNNPWFLTKFNSQLYTSSTVNTPELTSGNYESPSALIQSDNAYYYLIKSYNSGSGKIEIDEYTGAITFRGIDNTKFYGAWVKLYLNDTLQNSLEFFQINPPYVEKHFPTSGNVGGGTPVTFTGFGLDTISSAEFGILHGTELVTKGRVNHFINQTPFGFTLITPVFTVIDKTTDTELSIRLTFGTGDQAKQIILPDAFVCKAEPFIYLKQNGNQIQKLADGDSDWVDVEFEASSSHGIGGLLATATNGFTIRGDGSKVLTVLLLSDLVITNRLSFFTIGSENIVFDGAGHVVTIKNTQHPGLIRNGTRDIPGYTNITIKNLGVETEGSSSLFYFISLASDNGSGWICQNYFANQINSGIVRIESCYSTRAITYGSGGICGSHAGLNMSGSARMEITSCYSTGAIANGSGGICGANAGSNMSGTARMEITSCYSTGAISCSYDADFYSSGGICGPSAGSLMSGSASLQITGCYSTGTMTGYTNSSGASIGAGGICGAYAGGEITGSANLKISNCYVAGEKDELSENYVGPESNSTAGAVTIESSYYGKGDSTSGWLDSVTFNCLYPGKPQTKPGVGTIWTSYAADTPWLLSTFVSNLYEPNFASISSGDYTTGSGKAKSGYKYQLVGSLTGVSVDRNTGVIQYTGIAKAQTIITPIIAFKPDYSAYFIDYYVVNPGQVSITSINIQSGNISGGFPVEINGNNLFPCKKVTFGDVAGIIIGVAKDYSKITVIVPASIKTGPVNVTVYGFVGSTVIPNGFTYTNNLFIRQTSGATVQISNDESDESTWADISWPYTIVNKITGILTVNVLSDFTVASTSQYFIIGSENIEFNGQGHTVTVYSVTDYPGLVKNGSLEFTLQVLRLVPGKTNIKIIGFRIDAPSPSTLQKGSGWIGNAFFANSISSGTVEIRNCSANGSIDGADGFSYSYTGSGRILGMCAGERMENAKIIIDSCYSEGSIQKHSGGILGSYAGNNMSNSRIEITSCFSLGDITNNSGGIVGMEAGNMHNSRIIITSCFSSGNVTNNSGGLVGAKAGDGMSGNSDIIISKCYVAGTLDNDNFKFFGNDVNSEVSVPDNSNLADTTWSDTNASTALVEGVPNTFPGDGTIWTSEIAGTPWKLTAFN